MKKEIINSLIFWLGYTLFLVIANSLYSFRYWPLYVGGIIGLFMSNLDHLLYIFVLKPYELTSQRALMFFKNKEYKNLLHLIYDTREERTDLIFHTFLFQVIFTVLTFWVVTSSGSLFAKGLVLSYFLSLVIFNLKKYVVKMENNFIWQVIALFTFGLLV